MFWYYQVPGTTILPEGVTDSWCRPGRPRQELCHAYPPRHGVRMPVLAHWPYSASERATGRTSACCTESSIPWPVLWAGPHQDRTEYFCMRDGENLCMSLFANNMDPSHRLHCLLPPPRQHMYNIRDFAIYPRVGHRQRFKDKLIPCGLANWQWLYFCDLYNTCFGVTYCSLVL